MASTTCGWCDCMAHMEPLTALQHTTEVPWGRRVQAAYACANCRGINLASTHPMASDYGRRGGDDAGSYFWGWDSVWLPRTRAHEDFPDVPQHIAEAATEATLCVSVGAHRAVGSLARAVLEATAKDQGVSNGTLQKKIDELASRGLIRELVRDQAHEIRHFGNDMAHGDFADPVEEEEAREILILMKEVLREVYQAPAELARVKARREGNLP